MTKQPNILILMIDQLNGTLFLDGPADFLHAPALKALAARSVRFRNSYTGSPLCAPGRAAFMSGRLPSLTGVYDNASGRYMRNHMDINTLEEAARFPRGE